MRGIMTSQHLNVTNKHVLLTAPSGKALPRCPQQGSARVVLYHPLLRRAGLNKITGQTISTHAPEVCLHAAPAHWRSGPNQFPGTIPFFPWPAGNSVLRSRAENTVVALKAAEQNASVYSHLSQSHQAKLGFPPGVVNILNGLGKGKQAQRW